MIIPIHTEPLPTPLAAYHRLGAITQEAKAVGQKVKANVEPVGNGEYIVKGYRYDA